MRISYSYILEFLCTLATTLDPNVQDELDYQYPLPFLFFFFLNVLLQLDLCVGDGERHLTLS